MQSRRLVFRVLYITLFIIALILFVLGIKSNDNKIYLITFQYVVIIFWSLIGIFTKKMIYEARYIFRINRKKEIKVHEYEVWIYRILAVFWIIFSIKVIMDNTYV